MVVLRHQKGLKQTSIGVRSLKLAHDQEGCYLVAFKLGFDSGDHSLHHNQVLLLRAIDQEQS